MSAPRPSPAIRFFPSLSDAAFLMPLILLFGPMQGTKVLLGDSDTGWHLRSGDWILANGRVPDHDFFSFTKPGQPWFAWEWLWDAVFAWLHQYWGLAAVVLVSALVICATSAVLFRTVRRSCRHDLIAIAITFLAIYITALHWLARPHLFTLLFTAVFYSVLEASRERPGRMRVLFALPLLTVLWTNIHGGFLAGLLLILAYAAGEMATALVETQDDARKVSLARGRVYLLTVAGCIAASLVNPYGYRLHLHIYRYLTDSFLFDHIAEFFAINFRHPNAIFYELLFLLAAVAVYRAIVRKDFVHAFAILGWGHLALYSQRNIPLFAVVTAPVVASMVGEWFDALRTSRTGWLRRAMASLADAETEFCVLDRMPRVYLASALGVLMLAGLLAAPTGPARFRSQWNEKTFPVAALEHFKRTGTPQTLFTLDQWGGYLIYSLYPSMKVFVDGRSDFYGAKFDEAYLDILGVKWGWESTLHRYGVDTVLLPVEAPLSGALKESTRWRVVYDDGIAIVFRSAEASKAANAVSIANSGTNRDRAIAKQKLTTQVEYPSTRGERP